METNTSTLHHKDIKLRIFPGNEKKRGSDRIQEGYGGVRPFLKSWLAERSEGIRCSHPGGRVASGGEERRCSFPIFYTRALSTRIG